MYFKTAYLTFINNYEIKRYMLKHSYKKHFVTNENMAILQYFNTIKTSYFNFFSINYKNKLRSQNTGVTSHYSRQTFNHYVRTIFLY